MRWHEAASISLTSPSLALTSLSLAVIIVVLVLLDFGDGGPVIEVISGLIEGMVGRCRALEEVKEPGGHGLGDFFVKVVESEE
jgi:hypothetical protein